MSEGLRSSCKIEGIGTRRVFLCQRLRPASGLFFPVRHSRQGDTKLGDYFRCIVGPVVFRPTPPTALFVNLIVPPTSLGIAISTSDIAYKDENALNVAYGTFVADVALRQEMFVRTLLAC